MGKSAAPQTLRQRRKEALREEIITVARNLFMDVGYDAFSMRKLAERVGCSAGNLYLYFPSREVLFRHLIDDSFAELHEMLVRPEGGSGGPAIDPVVQLKRGMRTYIEFGVRHPDAYGVAFLVRRPTEREPIKPHPSFEVLRSIVARCIAAKRFRRVDVELASQILWTSIHGVTSLLIQLPQFPWVASEELVDTVIDNAVAPFTRPPKGRS
jgi:AcrR family transcriptional regulator